MFDLAKRTKWLWLVLVSMMILCACGDDDTKKNQGGPALNKVDQAFQNASRSHKIPLRILLAVAFAESGMNPSPSTALALGSTASDAQPVGVSLGQTAFGVSFAELGLVDEEASHSLSIQVEAYAKWLAQKIKDQGIELNANPNNSDQKFQWLWQVSQLHRKTEQLQKRSTRVLFTKQLINTLNTGAIWKDQQEQQTIELKAEQPELKTTELKDSDQKLFRMREESSEIGNTARSFEVGSIAGRSTNNKPRRILVTHCPFNLSTCIELQQENDYGLNAHYLIPTDASVIDKPIQVRPHSSTINLRNTDGSIQQVNDALVVSLVGMSGRYTSGIRKQSNPNWFTHWQLSYLGNVTQSICERLNETDGSIDVDSCRKPSPVGNLSVALQAKESLYHWGQIPDFDPSIFDAYLLSVDHTIAGESTLSLADKRQIYQAGENIRMKSSFPATAKWLHLERAVRCNGDSQKIEWATVQTEAARGKSEREFIQNIEDGGPNQDGRHYYRLLVYNAENELLAWSTLDLVLQKFDAKGSFASKPCMRAL